jgi:hypothetical protein
MQTTIPKLGAGVFLSAMLAILAAFAWDSAVMNVIYELRDLILRHVGSPFGGIFEFVALLLWALVVTVIFVVVAVKQGKKIGS